MSPFVDHGAAWITTAASNLNDGLVHVPPPNLLAAILSGCERGKQRLPKAGRSGRAQTSEVAPAASWSCLALSKSLHNLSLSGYCAVTTAGASDCAVGESGMWVASSTFPGVRRAGLLAACAHKCLGCARCNFVSFSQKGDECGWYHACELPLQTKFDDTFHTLRLKASSRFLDHRMRNERFASFRRALHRRDEAAARLLLRDVAAVWHEGATALAWAIGEYRASDSFIVELLEAKIDRYIVVYHALHNSHATQCRDAGSLTQNPDTNVRCTEMMRRPCRPSWQHVIIGSIYLEANQTAACSLSTAPWTDTPISYYPLAMLLERAAPSATLAPTAALLRACPAAAAKLTPQGDMPLHVAIEAGASDAAVAAVLAVYPLAAVTQGRDGRLPLHVAAAWGRSSRLVAAVLHAHPAAARTPDLHGYVPLHHALLHGAPHNTTLMLLGGRGEAATLPGPHGETALHLAAEFGADADTVR